jgi:hypothetical protein
VKASFLLKRHKEFWTTIEAAVWDDVQAALHGTEINPKIRRRIAYNAAFEATYLYHKLSAHGRSNTR